MAWIEFGWIGKPHGLNGGFFVTGDTSPDAVLTSGIPVRFKSPSPEAETHELLQAQWMPKGWKLTLSGIESPEAAKKLKGTPLFIEMEPNEGDPNSFFPSELTGFAAIDSNGKRLGALQGVERLPAGPDRWWFSGENDSWCVPATAHFITNVRKNDRVIELTNVDDILDL
jgi:ribosomal 30S subunit maturation factor RimM